MAVLQPINQINISTMEEGWSASDFRSKLNQLLSGDSSGSFKTVKSELNAMLGNPSNPAIGTLNHAILNFNQNLQDALNLKAQIQAILTQIDEIVDDADDYATAAANSASQASTYAANALNYKNSSEIYHDAVIERVPLVPVTQTVKNYMICTGYYNAVDGKFYQDSSYTILITSDNIVYMDLFTGYLYSKMNNQYYQLCPTFYLSTEAPSTPQAGDIWFAILE